MNAIEQVRAWWQSRSGVEPVSAMPLNSRPSVPVPMAARPVSSASTATVAGPDLSRTIVCPQCGSKSKMRPDYDPSIDAWFCPVCPYEKRVELPAADDALIRSLQRRKSA